jgi:hypothetical protein
MVKLLLARSEQRAAEKQQPNRKAASPSDTWLIEGLRCSSGCQER